MMRSVPKCCKGYAKKSLFLRISLQGFVRNPNNNRSFSLNSSRRSPSTVPGSSQPIVIPKHEPLADEESEMLQSIDIDDMPRVQKRYAKEFEAYNVLRIKEIFEKKYKIIMWSAGFTMLIVSIYIYTIYNVKQETFLEEIDEEIEFERNESAIRKV